MPARIQPLLRVALGDCWGWAPRAGTSGYHPVPWLVPMPRLRSATIPLDILPAYRKTGLPSSDVLTYAILRAHAGQDGQAWPSLPTLAEELGGVSERTVRHSLDRLAEAGVLTREDRRPRTTLYILNPPETWGSYTPSCGRMPIRPPMGLSYALVEAIDTPSCGLFKEVGSEDGIEKTFSEKPPRKGSECGVQGQGNGPDPRLSATILEWQNRYKDVTGERPQPTRQARAALTKRLAEYPDLTRVMISRMTSAMFANSWNRRHGKLTLIDLVSETRWVQWLAAVNAPGESRQSRRGPIAPGRATDYSAESAEGITDPTLRAAMGLGPKQDGGHVD